MEAKAWKVQCRIPGCAFLKAGEGGFVEVDELLLRHLLTHTQREISEAIMSLWSLAGGFENGPISAISAGEVMGINREKELAEKLRLAEEQLKQLKDAVAAKMANGPTGAERRAAAAAVAREAPYGKSMHELVADALLELGGAGEVNTIKDVVATMIGEFLKGTARINQGLSYLQKAGRCERIGDGQWRLIGTARRP